MSDAFTKPSEPADSPADFDIDAWLSGATLPERACTVYGDGAGYAKWQELDDELQRAQRAEDDADATFGSKAKFLELAQRVEAQQEAIDASRLRIRFRALLTDESEPIQEKHKKNKDAITYHMLAAQVISPKLTADQFKAIRAKIGEGQFQTILETAAEASYGRRVEVPFSAAASALLATGGSSES